MSYPGQIIANQTIQGDYRKIVFFHPEIAQQATAGQFIHIKINGLNDHILRRPFSICDTDINQSTVTVIYKIVGSGTEFMSQMKPGSQCDLLGPLGKGFTHPSSDTQPIIIAGGYGSAATYLLSKKSLTKGILLLGARTEADLILINDFQEQGFEVQVTTEDGSLGTKGRITKILEPLLTQSSNQKQRFYACGPNGMLMAVGQMLMDHHKGDIGELSLDHLMCCGVGACFSCVVKIKDEKDPTQWRYARTCSEGPVFPADQVWYC